MTRMTDKVALAVGGASGIGLAITRRLAAEWARMELSGTLQHLTHGSRAK